MRYELRLRRFDPTSGRAAYWQSFEVDLGPRQSVLDAILQVRDEVDGSVGIRCSCQQAICGSCGVRMNGKPGLACNTHLDEASARLHGTGWNDSENRDGTPSNVIEVEPMGNMPVIRDLIVDMDAVHWKKIQRVTPYLINKEPVPEREYIVAHENMVDITQTMACIQCGACVSNCLSMEIDPLFAGPAALAKAYRFIGDPRDAEPEERLKDLSEDEHGIYDCTHCFNCIDACPKGVDPMSQIMLSPAGAKRRIDRLEAADIITGYRAVIDHGKLNGTIEAFIELRFAGATQVDDIESAADIPEVIEAFTAAGDPDALARIRVHDLEHLKRVVDRIRRTGRVTGTKTLIVLGATASRP